MSYADDERELAKFRAELPVRQLKLQAAKDAFKVREEREIFQSEVAALTREERTKVAANLKDENRILGNKIDQRQQRIHQLEMQQRAERVEEAVARALSHTPDAGEAAQQTSAGMTPQETAQAIERLKAESAALKNLIQLRDQRIRHLNQLKRPNLKPVQES